MLRNNLRAQLIVPVTLTILVLIACAIVFTIVKLNSSSRTLNREVKQSFAQIEQSTAVKLEELTERLDDRLNEMQAETSAALEKSTSKSLRQISDSVEKKLEAISQASGSSLIQLMSLYAVDAVITRDYAALNSYVRSAHQNPNIVFAFYRDHKGIPLTRYLNRKNEILKSYLPEGRPDIEKIIRAGKNDPNTLVLSQDIKDGSEVIGSLSIALDRTNIRQQERDMKRWFEDLVVSNSRQVKAILGEENKTINQNMRVAIDTVRQEITASSHETLERITAMNASFNSHFRNNIILGSILGALLIIAFLLFNARSIIKLLGGEPADMVQFARRIADGDLCSGKDGIKVPGSLQAALQEMSASLCELIGNILDRGRTLEATSNELSLAAEDMTRGAEQSASKADTVAAATEELSTNMATVTRASEQAAQNVELVASAMEEMTSAVQEISRSTAKAKTMTAEAVNTAESSTQKVNSLGIAASEISKVTEVITQISDQTNLLALNATIEAARAGEAGKGFAVVANEIKSLAQKTVEATGDIKAKIESIQSSTDITVKEISEIRSVINSVNDIVSNIASSVEEQSVTAGNISDNVKDASDGINEVHENVSQSTSVAGEIARDIVEVSEVAKEAQEGSLRLRKSSQEIKEIGQAMNEETRKFNLGAQA